MKVICNQRDLSTGINIVQKAVSIKTTMPILTGIYLKAAGDKLKLVGTDLDLGIETYIDAEVLSPGEVVISSRIFGEIVRKFPDDDVSIDVDSENNVVLRCQNSEFTLIGQPAAEYPELPTIDEKEAYLISKDLFGNMIRQTVFACSIDETRPILTGVLMEIEDKQINMVALDGYRMAFRRGAVQNEKNSKEVVPGKTLMEVSRILNEDPNESVRIFFTDKHVLFHIDQTRIISRLLEGEFINYKQIIPNQHKTKVKVNKKELSDSIERASLLAREGKNNLIRLSIRDEEMIIHSNAEIGKVFECVRIELEGEDLDIGFNSKYFLDGIRAIDSEEVILNFTTNLNPCIMQPIDSDSYTYLVLPVRIPNQS